MSGKSGSGAGIGVLKALVVFAVVAACVGLGFVVLYKGGDSAPGKAPQNQDSTSPAETPPSRSATSGSQTSPGSTTTAIVPGKAAGTTVTTKTAPQTLQPTKSASDTAGRPKTTATKTSVEPPADPEAAREAARAKYLASLKVGPAPTVEPMTWDDTGELVVGNRRFLTKLATLAKLDLSRTERKNLEHLKTIFRPRIERQLNGVQQAIEKAVEAYNEAASRGDKEEMAKQSYSVHEGLIPFREEILRTVDVQLAEILKKALPDR